MNFDERCDMDLLLVERKQYGDDALDDGLISMALECSKRIKQAIDEKEQE